MNPDDAFERSLASLYEAALDDARWPVASALIEETCGAVGSTLWAGAGYGADERLFFARLLYRGEPRDGLAREYYEVYHPHDERPPRHRTLPRGQPFHAPELYTETELKTSIAYNEGWRRLRGQNGLTVHLDLPDAPGDSWAFRALGDPAGGDGWESAQLRPVERPLPHFRRCVRIRQALEVADPLGAGLAGPLDNDRIGVWYSWTAGCTVMSPRAEPGLKLEHRHRLSAVEELAGDGAPHVVPGHSRLFLRP